MIDTKKLMQDIIQTTPRVPEKGECPFSTGDIFSDHEGNEFSVIEINGLAVKGILVQANKKKVKLEQFKHWQDINQSGFQFDQAATIINNLMLDAF